MNHVVIGSSSIATTLLHSRGDIYSDRDQAPMSVHLLSDHLRPVFLPYGDDWRLFRKFSNSVLNTNAAANYEPIQRSEAIRMVYSLIASPKQYEKWLERYSASVILRLAYGITLHSTEDPLLKRILMVDHHLERIASPGVYLVDTFPSLMYLPDWLAPFKREGKRLHAEELDLFSSLIEDVDRRLRAGDKSAEGCFTAKYLEDKEKWDMNPGLAAYIIGTMFEAASGTTSAAMMSWLLAMVLHPDKLKKLQAELDKVCGDEMPDFHHVPHLPYLRACVKETLRWRPVTAGGLPHKLTARNDIFTLDGIDYLIPKDSLVHWNQWAIHRDPDLYPEDGPYPPEAFCPERWLDPKSPVYREPLDTHPNIKNWSSFGFGRRTCPGQNIAERSLYIETALIGWTCDVTRKKGQKVGEGLCDREYKEGYIDGFNTQPKWFEFEVMPRKERKKVLGQEYKMLWGETEGDGG